MRSEEILEKVFKLVEELKEEEVEDEYIPYVNDLLTSKVFRPQDIEASLSKVLMTLPDTVIDVPKLSFNMSAIMANLIA